MSVLIINAYLWTARAFKDLNTGRSGAALPFLVKQHAHVGPTPAEDFMVIPQEVALVTEFRVTMDSGTDIVEGDYVTRMTRSDGVTPWPSGNPEDTYHVVYIREGAPLLLPARFVYIKRVRQGGLPSA